MSRNLSRNTDKATSSVIRHRSFVVAEDKLNDMGPLVAVGWLGHQGHSCLGYTTLPCSTQPLALVERVQWNVPNALSATLDQQLKYSSSQTLRSLRSQRHINAASKSHWRTVSLDHYTSLRKIRADRLRSGIRRTLLLSPQDQSTNREPA